MEDIRKEVDRIISKKERTEEEINLLVEWVIMECEEVQKVKTNKRDGRCNLG